VLAEAEVAVVATSKITGTLLQARAVQVADNILIPATSLHNMLLPNSSSHNNILVLPKVIYSKRRRKKRIVRIYSDRRKSFE
jgi:hypothetical protein